MRAQLTSETDLVGFRAEARRLLAQRVPPEQVLWQAAAASHADLFDAPSPPGVATAVPVLHHAATATATATVPASFVGLCEAVILHCDPGRFGLMYKLLWRLVHEPALRGDPLDADMLQAQRMAQAVRRDMHKMKAFVRFRQVRDAQGRQDPWHVAWFEPAHHIVQAVGPWFAQRFTQMRWAILTPECSVAWDGVRLTFGPGATPGDAPPADAGEALWLTYYRSIFNPARLKLKMMQKEMPRKYWPHLPETRLIASLAAQAGERSEAMVRQAPTEPARRIPGR